MLVLPEGIIYHLYLSVDFPQLFPPSSGDHLHIFGGFFHRTNLGRQDFLRRDSEATRQLSDELNRFLIVAGLKPRASQGEAMGKPWGSHGKTRQKYMQKSVQ